MTRLERIQTSNFDYILWKKLYTKNPEQYLRRRLSAILAIKNGQSMPSVQQQLGCSKRSLQNWCDWYLAGGFTRLLRRPVRNQGGQLAGKKKS